VYYTSLYIYVKVNYYQ